MVTIHARVSGRVQGVFFRRYTQKRAQELQLAGWVKNSEDGKVELIATGEQDKIEQFIEWLWQGSPNAVVKEVCWELISQQSFADFSIKR
ncbi:MAG: acylphosphatase [Proteobacteria bacterium]|nr:acylphosphatase [Pseudomonadota bacterium]